MSREVTISLRKKTAPFTFQYRFIPGELLVQAFFAS